MKIFNKNSNKRNFSFKDLLFHLIFAGIILLAMVIIPTESNRLGLLVLKSPIKIILNIIPILLTGLFLQAIFGKFRIAIIINSIFYLVLYVINRTKIMYRSAPIRISDLKMVSEAATMVKNSYLPDIKAIFAIIAIIFLIIFLLFKVNNDRIFRKQRIILGAFVIIISGILYPSVFAKDDIYNNLESSGNVYNQIDHFDSKGFNYSFIYNIKKSFVSKPKNYDEKKLYNIENRDLSENISVIKYNERPNIVWIMGEAFTDLSDNDVFSFTEKNDPLKNYRKIKNESVFNGRIVTPSFGGGTGDTEFDVLTGTLTIDCAPDGSVSFGAIHRETEALPNILKKIGYDTSAFHPGYAWFYGRSDVYPKIGFDETHFLEEIENPDIKGGYVSEKQFSEIYRNRFLEKIKSDNPVFSYAVDIQNHGPYDETKYGEVIDFNTSVEISEAAKNCLGSYFLGIKDMDKKLGEIYEMINSIDEPTIMVFYGDHLPYLGTNPSGFDEIGMSLSNETLEKEIEYYSTPFIICANEKGRAFLNSNNVEVKKGGVISANYLSSLFLDMLDYNKIDNFFMYNSELRKKLPIISRNYFYDGENAYLRSKAPENISEIYDDYRSYEYYRINK